MNPRSQLNINYLQFTISSPPQTRFHNLAIIKPMKRLLLLFLILFTLSCTQEETISASVLINAVLYDGYELANDDEMISLINITDTPVDISGWQLADGDSGTAVLPPNTILQPNELIWLTKNGTAASNRYQHVTDFELEDSHSLVANLSGGWPSLTDEGDELMLLDANLQLVDMVVYKLGNRFSPGWEGATVEPTYIEEEGIFLQRVNTVDTDTAVDWQQVSVIVENGREIGSPRRIGKPLTQK